MDKKIREPKRRHRTDDDEPGRLRKTNRLRRRRNEEEDESEEDDDVDGGDETAKMMPRVNNNRAFDEVIGFLVPRKPRSVSKRPERIIRQFSSSASPMNANGSKEIPPTSSLKDSMNPEELEIEIAEVLYGLRTQSNSAVVDKRKRLGQESENLSISSTTVNAVIDPEPKIDNLLRNLDKNPITKSENVTFQSVKLNFANVETPAKDSHGDAAVIKVCSTSLEKFEIDLMAPPVRKSDGDILSVEADAEMRTMLSTQDKDVKVEEPERKKARSILDTTRSDSSTMINESSIDLQLDLRKADRDNNSESLSGNNNLHPHVQKQHQPQLKVAKDQHPHTEKTAQASSLQLPMSLANWPGLPPIGYMAPLQGVVSMDGCQVPPTPLQPLFPQPRPKRCETHSYIARNIHCMQQLMKMNPFWPVISSMQDKGQGLTSMADAQRKQQILLQRSLPPGAPTNMTPGSAFILPFNQQEAAAASLRPPLNASTSASVNGLAAAAPTPASVSFNYPNMPNETQYLAVLQNNAYPFPIPAPNFRGTHPQPIPFFYPSQMIHPNMPHQQIPPGQQNASISSNSPSSQKQHIQREPQQGTSNMNDFSAAKTMPPQSSQPHQARNFETQALASNSTQGKNNKQQQSQQQNSKPGGVEGLPLTFSPSFASMSSGNTAQRNNEYFQKLLETDRRNFQVMQSAAVAQAPQQRKNLKGQEEGKNGLRTKNEEKKGLAPKPLVTNAQSIGFTRPDSIDLSVSSANNHRLLQNMQFQQQQHFQQQMAQFQKQQMQQHFVDARNNNKTPPTSSSDHLATTSPSTAAKFSNTVSGYPQNPVQTSEGQSLSTSTLKNVPQQQQPRPPQSHTQISFGSGQKSQTDPHGQQPPSNLPSSSPTTSLSKGAGGSPRTPSSNSQGKKTYSVSSQHSKNPSILGNAHNIASSNSSIKSLGQQQFQQQVKQMVNNKTQMSFSPACMQTQPPQLTSNAGNTTSGYYLPRPVTLASSITVEAKTGTGSESNITKGSFSYVHTGTAGAQVKPSLELTQQAGKHEPLTRK